MLVAEVVVHRLEVVEVDEQQRERRAGAVRPRERGVEPAAQLPDVEQASQRVGRGLLSAAVVAKRVREGDRRAARKGLDLEQVLVRKRLTGTAEAEQRGDSFAGRHRGHDPGASVRYCRLTRPANLRE